MPRWGAPLNADLGHFKGAHGGRDTEISRQHGASDAGGPPPHGDARPVGVTAELWSYGVVDLA